MEKEKFKFLTAVEIFLLSPDEKEVLLIHRSKDKEYLPNYYAGLGGKMDNPEQETPFEGALREMQEESGYTFQDLEYIDLKGLITVQDRFGKWNIFDFVGKVKSKIFKTPKDTPEGILKWVSFENFKNINLIQDLRNGTLEKILQSEGFIWMKSKYNDADILTDFDINII